MKYPHNLYYFTSQLKLDIAEMKSLLETAARSKVRDILSVEVRERERDSQPELPVHQVRRLETELVEVNDSLKAEQSSDKESAAAPKPQTETVKKVVESQLKDYCKKNLNLPSSLRFENRTLYLISAAF